MGQAVVAMTIVRTRIELGQKAQRPNVSIYWCCDVLRVRLRPLEARSQLSPVAPQAACQESFMNSVDFPVGRGIELWARLVCVCFP